MLLLLLASYSLFQGAYIITVCVHFKQIYTSEWGLCCSVKLKINHVSEYSDYCLDQFGEAWVQSTNMCCVLYVYRFCSPCQTMANIMGPCFVTSVYCVCVCVLVCMCIIGIWCVSA